MSKHHLHIEQPTVTYKKANNLEILAQKCWKTKDLEEKRSVLLSMVEHFRFKNQYQKYIERAKIIQSVNELDVMASNLMLVDKNRVIK